MKTFIVKRIYFYCIVIISFLIVSDSMYTKNQYFKKPDHSEIKDVITTLRVVHNLQDEIESFSHWFASDLLVHVVDDLVNMYKKIFEVVLIYYFSPGYISQHDFHNKIIKIISNDIGLIIDYLCQGFIDSIFNHELTWQERICQCASILSIILIIKTSMDEMPKILNFNQAKKNIKENILRITLCLKEKKDDSE